MLHECYHDELRNRGPLILREVCSGRVVARGRQNNNTVFRSPLQILQKLLQTNTSLCVIPVVILADILDSCCLEDTSQRVCREDQVKAFNIYKWKKILSIIFRLNQDVV